MIQSLLFKFLFVFYLLFALNLNSIKNRLANATISSSEIDGSSSTESDPSIPDVIFRGFPLKRKRSDQINKSEFANSDNKSTVRIQHLKEYLLKLFFKFINTFQLIFVFLIILTTFSKTILFLALKK